MDVVAGIRQIVECGGDTDTIASMYGQIVGAVIGSKALPVEIVGRIDAISLVRATANRFASASIAIE
jgi:ADP-ribosylglycohydrolase